MLTRSLSSAIRSALLNVFRYITFRTGGAHHHGSAVRLPVRPGAHRSPAGQPGQGPADPRGRAGNAFHQKKGTPTMGGLHDPRLRSVVDAAVGRSRQRLCLDRAGRHARFGAHRLLRRLSQGHEAAARGLRQARELASSSSCRRRRRMDHHARSAGDPAGTLTLPFFKDFADPSSAGSSSRSPAS